jgi:hypothetical protein
VYLLFSRHGLRFSHEVSPRVERRSSRQP